jgi:hypothetical protein
MQLPSIEGLIVLPTHHTAAAIVAKTVAIAQARGITVFPGARPRSIAPTEVVAFTQGRTWVCPRSYLRLRRLPEPPGGTRIAPTEVVAVGVPALSPPLPEAVALWNTEQAAL